MFAEDGKWLVDYGSYANGYHSTRSEAIEVATSAARREKREIVIEVAAGAALAANAVSLEGDRPLHLRAEASAHPPRAEGRSRP